MWNQCRNGTELGSVVRTELFAVTTTSKVHFKAEYHNLVELLTELYTAGEQTFLGKRVVEAVHGRLHLYCVSSMKLSSLGLNN